MSINFPAKDTMHSSSSRCVKSSVVRSATVTFLVLAWSSLAFCGEIHEAAKNNDLERIEALLKDSPDLLLTKDDRGYTPLHSAAESGSKDVAVFLLAHHADVNARDRFGHTPLHLAALNGHKDLAEVLLLNKAEVNAKDNSGWTPLHDAAFKGNRGVAELLISNNADINAKDYSGGTPLDDAISEKHADVAELLRQRTGQEMGADHVNLQQFAGTQWILKPDDSSDYIYVYDVMKDGKWGYIAIGECDLLPDGSTTWHYNEHISEFHINGSWMPQGESLIFEGEYFTNRATFLHGKLNFTCVNGYLQDHSWTGSPYAYRAYSKTNHSEAAQGPLIVHIARSSVSTEPIIVNTGAYNFTLNGLDPVRSKISPRPGNVFVTLHFRLDCKITKYVFTMQKMMLRDSSGRHCNPVNFFDAITKKSLVGYEVRDSGLRNAFGVTFDVPEKSFKDMEFTVDDVAIGNIKDISE